MNGNRIGAWFHKRRWGLLSLVFLTCAVLCSVSSPSTWPFEWHNPVWFSSVSVQSDSIADSVSTLWPLLVTLVITMLGSLITTYVFLKEALDRTSDEKPYYRTVISAYRNSTLRSLMRYAYFSLALITVVVVLYVLLYFKNIRTSSMLRVILGVFYILALGASGRILRTCIRIDRGLHNVAQKQLKERLQRDPPFPSASIPEIERLLQSAGFTEGRKLEWLQIAADGLNIDEKKFIARFSEWEKLVLSMAEQAHSLFSKQSLYEQISMTVENGIRIFRNKSDNIELNDAQANGWKEHAAFRQIYTCERSLQLTPERFIDTFQYLSECRDLFQVLLDTEARKGRRKEMWRDAVKKSESVLIDSFLYFRTAFSVEGFRILPRVEVFFPSGQFALSNFYGIRFEDSAFRASRFLDAVFARSKLFNSNFSVSKFENCEFFSVDSRNCSFSNTLLESSNLEDAIFDDVDFTGAVLDSCNLKRAAFHNAVLLNMTVFRTDFGANEFLNCKISNVELHFCSAKSLALQNCNFSDSVISNIRLRPESGPEPWGAPHSGMMGAEFFRILGDCPPLSFGSAAQEEAERLKSAPERFKLDCNPFPDSGDGSRESLQIWRHIREEACFSMQECIFQGTVMPSARFFRADLDQSVLTGAQLDRAQFACAYMGGCIMGRVNLRQALLFGVDLHSAVLQDAILYRADCCLVNFEDAALQSLHASGANFRYCSFCRSDCSRSDLTVAKVCASTFQDSILTEAELTHAEFRDVIFNNIVAGQMLASYTRFSCCRLLNAFLAQSNFNYTVFSDCLFELASFSNSTVTGATFTRCDFKNSDFRGTCFIRTAFQDCRRMEAEFFGRCKFIDCTFSGTDEAFEIALRETADLVVNSAE